MTHKGESLSGLDGQIEVIQDRFIVHILKVEIIELDMSLETRHIPMIGLDDIWICVDQGEGAFCGGESRLDLCPECRKVLDGEQELIEADDKEVPRTDRNNPFRGAQATEINQDGSEDSAERIECGEHKREHEAALHIDLIRLLIRFIERFK